MYARTVIRMRSASITHASVIQVTKAMDFTANVILQNIVFST